MEELITGLVPGLPDDLREQILARAEGVPLYAVETVRMLLDRGLLAQAGTTFRPTASVDTLEVPETLHALVAARLDGLTPEERRVVQDGSVLGKTFTKQGLAALTGLAERELEPLLASLLRKEVVSIQADPRSPERGQYSFLQDIVKHVAYETIARRDRKEKHLAAGRYLASLWGGEEDEIVEVVASHYVDAYRAAPDAPDAAEIADRVRTLLVRAAERAGSLAATAEAQRAYERALELAEDPAVQAELHERAGMEGYAGGRADEAAVHFDRAIALFEAAGATHAAARVSAKRAEIAWDRGRLEEGLESMGRAFEVLSGEERDEDVAELAAQLGRFLFFAGEPERALARIESALDMSEALSLPEVFAQALNTKAIILHSQGRPREAMALMRYALQTALEYGKPSAALRAYYNLTDLLSGIDRWEEAIEVMSSGLDLARRVGNRNWEWALLGQIYPFFAAGQWDRCLATIDEMPQADWAQARFAFVNVSSLGVAILVHRGALAEAEGLTDHFREIERSADVQERSAYGSGIARLLLAKGDTVGALQKAEAAFASRGELGIGHDAVREAFVVAVEAALDLTELAKVEQLLGIVEGLPLGRQPQFMRAQASRFRGRLAALRRAPEEAERGFKGAAGLFREMAFPFYLAVTELEHAEWLAGEGRAAEAEPLLAEAREIFERLGAAAWLERCGAVLEKAVA